MDTSRMKLAGQIVPQAHAVLRSAGIYGEPSANTQSMGYDINGKALYGDKGLLQSQDPSVGAKHVQTFSQVLDPFGVLDEKDHSSLDYIGTAANDAAFSAKLVALQQAGDKKGFITTLLNKFQQPIINKITSDPQKQDGIGAAFTAWNLYNNWGKMSPAQKSLGLANFGIQTYKTASGTNLAAKNIVDPTATTPGLNVGQALGLFSAGTNAYSLAKNWNQYNTLQKVAGGTQTVANIANLGKSFGMLGSGTTGAAAQVTAEQIAQAGWQSAPHLGIGALTGDAGAQALPGYKTVGQVGGKMVSVPAANAPVTESTLSQGAGFIADSASVAGIALGAKQVYSSWGKGGKANTVNGAVGGAAMAAGLYALGATNPYVLAGVVAASALGANVKSKESQRGATAVVYTNPYTAGPAVAMDIISGKSPKAAIKGALDSFKSGKSETQLGRDAVRGVFKDNGAVDKDFQFTLADGTKASIGADGDQGRHAITDPTKLSDNQKGLSHLNSYDIDYTNDLDYAAGLGGITLSRIMTGGKATNIDQVGGQFGNAALSNIGYGKDFSQGNFTTMTNNMKAMYSQSGIKSKSDALQLLNQAYAEHRIDDSDHVSGMQALNMVYDGDGYSTAQKLMNGRYQGINAAAQSPATPATVNPTASAVAGNAGSSGATPNSAGMTTLPLKPSANAASGMSGIANPGNSFLRSKTDVVQANKNRFGSLGSGANA